MEGISLKMIFISHKMKIRKEIRDLLDMTDQPEKQFKMALSIGETLQNPPLTKKNGK